jgi:hypothetical protein
MTQTGGIYHHPNYFDEPETFKPERYLNNPNGTTKGVNTTGFRDNFAKDKSGTGNLDIDSYARVNLLYFYNYQPPSYFPSSLALCLLLSHTHAPSLPEMKNGQISSSNHLNTMGNPFKLCISLIISSIVSSAACAWHTNSFWFSGVHLVI